MKKLLFSLFAYCLLFTFSSCTPNETFQGVYTCNDCLYTQLDFKKDGKVEILAGGIKAQGEFSLEEKTVIITTETSEYVFVIKDEHTLEGQQDAEGVYTKGM